MVHYTQAYIDYFWGWGYNYETISIPNGSTIVYSELLKDILTGFDGQALPPFGSLLAAIVALNPKGKDALNEIRTRIENNKELIINKELDDSFIFLQKISDVPESYKFGNKKIALLRAVFENCHSKGSLSQSKGVIARLKSKEWISPIKKKENITNRLFYKDFRALAILNNKFKTVDDIIQKIKELPEIEEDLLFEKDINIEPKDFIEELLVNKRTEKVAALVKMIWSGLQLPFHSVMPNEMPLGGVSDLTNKGDFDRLLISEYANDDLVFLSRLANNEALYLSRESPPTENKIVRVILIDISLKNWGTPKTIAFAILLAIAKHPKSTIDCEAFLVGDQLRPIKFDTVDDIVEALQFVEVVLNPVKGIEAYFEQYGTEKQKEIFVLTEKSLAKQYEMIRLENEWGNQINYWVYFDADGKIDLYKKLKNSKKHVQHLEIPLEELWNKNYLRKGVNKQSYDLLEETTAKKYYPILVQNGHRHKGYRQIENGEIFQVTKDKSLLIKRNPISSKGPKNWEILYEKLPIINHDYEVALSEKGEYIVLLFNSGIKEITLLNLHKGTEIKVPFKQWKGSGKQSFYFKNNYFYHYVYPNVWLINIDGEIEEMVNAESFDYSTLRFDLGKEKQKIEDEHNFGASVLTNLKKVSISFCNKLIINTFNIYIVGQGIYLNNATQEVKITASRNKKNSFIFNDGSSITLQKIGLLQLKSSNKNIPTIYIPSVLDQSIGMATESQFAGDIRYLNEPQFSVQLIKKGNEKLKEIKLLRGFTQLGLSECKSLMENVPTQLPYFYSHEKATEIITAYKQLGGHIEKIPLNKSFTKPITVIDSQDFLKLYIDPFIKTILDYEAKN